MLLLLLLLVLELMCRYLGQAVARVTHLLLLVVVEQECEMVLVDENRDKISCRQVGW